MNGEFDQSARELEVLAESSRLLTSTLDLGEVLDRLADMAHVRIDADIARIWLLDDTGEFLELRAQTGVILGAAGPKQRLPLRDSLAGWVIAHMEPVCIADVQADARLANRAWFANEGVVSLLTVPDRARRHGRSAFSRACRAPGGSSRRADMALARALTAPAVVAVRNAALYAEALARLEEIEAFQRVVSETLSSPELETALRAVVRELHGLLRSDAALCTHVDPQTRRLRMLIGIGTRTDGIAGLRGEGGPGVTGVVLRERRSVRSDDYLADPRFTRTPAVEAWARAEGIVSIIGAPILDAAGEIIAFLWAFNRTPRPFTARHEATMAGLAQQAALAVGKARSFEDERRRARQTAALLDIARACTSTLELTPLLKDIARRTVQAVGADGCAIFLWNGSRLVPVMAQLADGRADSALWERFKALAAPARWRRCPRTPRPSARASPSSSRAAASGSTTCGSRPSTSPLPSSCPSSPRTRSSAPWPSSSAGSGAGGRISSISP